MTIEGEALELRVLIGEADRWHGRPLHEAILERLMERGMAGATVLRGVEGFGRNAHLHTSKLLRLSEDLPVMLVVIDAATRIRAILPELDEMVADGLITVQPVEVIAYRGRGRKPPPG
jgi:PII-like signaling protein